MRPLCLLLLLAACGSPGVTVRKAVPPDRLVVRGLAVYPVQFTWDEPSIRSLELAQRLVALAVDQGRLITVGPTELSITGPWEDDPYRSSDAAHRLFAASVKPDEGVVLRATADDLLQSSSHTVLDEGGKARAAARNQQRTVRVILELLHPASHRRLYVLEAKRDVDPFAEDRPEWDPLPELTSLLEELTSRALALLVEDGLVQAGPRPLPFEWAFSPVASFAHTPDARPAYAAELSKLDPLTAEVILGQHVRFAAPMADDATQARLARIRDGSLLVTSAGSTALAPGDRITTAGGEAVTGPQVVARRMLRVPSGGTVPLEVDRGGRTLTVQLAAP